ncbi:hypothetical protein INT43_008681 [Umbelopsis isabellina]|uniref:Uncharacterized protein n=1 Tax=Mortierella isabellina TaxID=91625 RepID=A0A8H7PX65_MORIS|nr:hypothetical protein INT43_008681 [Umbelopsis isabellina]
MLRFTVIRKATAASAQRATSNGFHSSSVQAAISKFGMPAMSPTMTEGTIIKWKKKEGDEVAAGDIILEVETDKAQIDVDAADDGILAKILVQEGERVPVNTTIALLAEEGDDLSNIEIPKDEPAQAAPAEVKKAEEKPAAAPATPVEPIDHHDLDTSKLEKPLSPAVLSLLLKHGVKDASQIKPTGPNGRLLKGDVLGHLGLINYKAPPPFAKTAAPPRDQIVFAKPAAKEGAKAKAAEQPAIPMYISKSVAVDNLFNLRNSINATHNSDLTLDEFFAKAAARALRDVAKPSTAGPRSSGVVPSHSLGNTFSTSYKGGKFNIFNLAPPNYDFISNTYEPSKPYSLTISSSKKIGSSSQNTGNYVDLLDFLGGSRSVSQPKAVKMAASDDLYLSPAKTSSGFHSVELKLEGGEKKGQVLNDAKASVFLDRVEYYIQHPEELVA